jgi:LmbE family N-acetylglucosaminyl deacetylase
MSSKTILVIAAHPDDEIIGLGGTLAKHVNQGDQVSVVILGDGKSSRKTSYQPLADEIVALSVDETTAALKTLGVKKFFKEALPDNRFDSLTLLEVVKIVSGYMAKIKPEIVYTHHFGDLNVDHQVCAQAVITSARPIEHSFVKEIRMFETLSSTEMAGFELKSLFLPNLFIDITQELKTKIAAMACYKSELRAFPHPRSLKAIEANALVWGAKNNLAAAEAFHLFRSIQSNP